MFLSTINLTAEKTIGTVVPKSGGFQTNDISDKRRKAKPVNKKTKQNKKKTVKLQT